MKFTFVDTSYLLAVVLSDDEHHEKALRWQRVTTGLLVTTEYVLLELCDALTHGSLRDVAVNTVALLRTSPSVRVISASGELMDEGLTLFWERADKEWGLTDCISFVVMQRESIQESLTSDRHFEQAGFNALMLSSPP